jgi:hypothetical protein
MALTVGGIAGIITSSRFKFCPVTFFSPEKDESLSGLLNETATGQINFEAMPQTL